MLQSQSIFLCCVYIRLESDPIVYTRHAESVQQILDLAESSDTVLVLGDYKLPYLVWTFDDDVNGYLPINASAEQEIALTEPMLAVGLCQINDLTNINGRLLDLVFVNNPDSFEIIEPPSAILKIDPHHKPFVLKFDHFNHVGISPDQQNEEFEFDFKRCDFDVLNARISSVDWTHVLNVNSVDIAASRFYDVLYEIIHENVPKRRRRTCHLNRHPWWNANLRTLRNRLRKARTRYFRRRTAENKLNLQTIEDEYARQLDESFHDYLNRIQTNIKHDSSSFWSFIKQRKNATGIPLDVAYCNQLSSTLESSAELFAGFFSTVYNVNPPSHCQQSLDDLPTYNIHLPPLVLSSADVSRALSSVDAAKGPGPDCIPPLFVKKCASSLTLPVSTIFSQSLRDGIFPSVWKIASITPVHKSGNIHNVENYRPVSILSSLGKIFESLIYDAIYPALHHIISEHQHGFVKKRSTTTNLMTFTNSVITKLEKRHQIDAIYVDFSKAFDKVPHELAIQKLNRLGLPDWITHWLHSYLVSRKAYVKVRSARSPSFDTPSGVPQESHLGPLIFILFINDLCYCLKSSKLLYADDLKLYRTIITLVDCCALQADVDILYRWCETNGMEININKCKTISFCRIRSPICFDYKINGADLERVNSIKDLGVTVNSKMTFNEHIAATSAKAFAMLGFMRRNTKDFKDVYALKTLYCSLVRSVLEYAVVVWAPYQVGQAARMESVQRRFLRYALRTLPWRDPVDLPRYDERRLLIRLPTLAERRILLQRLFIYDVITGNIECASILEHVWFHAPPRRLRSGNLLWIPGHRTVYGYNNPLDVCCRIFNEVRDKFDFNISKNTFKIRIR